MNKRRLMFVILAMTGLGGCLAEDPEAAHDDVASQESAVEETPAPDQTDDMIKLRDRCEFSCGDVWMNSNFACDRAHPFAPHMGCFEPYCNNDDHAWAQCKQDAALTAGECDHMCDVIFGGSTNGGSHLPGNSP